MRLEMSSSPPKMMDSKSPSSYYIQNRVIGNGAYGTVYMAYSVQNKCVVAMKKIRVPVKEGVPASTLREVSMLKFINRMDHPNVIKLLDICNGEPVGDQFNLYLIFEHLEQDLATFLTRKHPLDLNTIKSISHQMLCGVDFLHSHRVIHKDIKPQNVLVSDQGLVKLADFGLAKTYNYMMKLTPVVVTLWYRSPEVLLNNKYDSSVDLWSVGCIVAELHLGKPLFPGLSEGDMVARIIKVVGTPPQSEWMSQVALSTFGIRQPAHLVEIIPRLECNCEHLLSSLLTFNSKRRISAKDALQHEYFNGSCYPVPRCNRI